MLRLLLLSFLLVTITNTNRILCANRPETGRAKSPTPPPHHSPLRHSPVVPDTGATGTADDAKSHQGPRTFPTYPASIRSSHRVEHTFFCGFSKETHVVVDTTISPASTAMKRQRTTSTTSLPGGCYARTVIDEDTTRHLGGTMHTPLARINTIRTALHNISLTDTLTLYELFLFTRAPFYSLSHKALATIKKLAPELLIVEDTTITISDDDYAELQASFAPIAGTDEIFISTAVLMHVHLNLSSKITPLIEHESTHLALSEEELNILYTQYGLIAHPKTITPREIQRILTAFDKVTRTYPLPTLSIYPLVDV